MPHRFQLKRGLDLPIAGEPQQQIHDGPTVGTVALVGDDYVGMKPTMEVAEGDAVRLGQVLFTDKKTAGVHYTSPGSGKVVAVNRGAKRKFQSIVIELEGDERERFTSFADHNLANLPRAQVCDLLIASGLWTAVRARPFGKVANPAVVPDAFFVTAMDTNPLAADPAAVLSGTEREFVAGLQALGTLTDGTTYLCTAMGSEIPGRDEPGIELAEFAGPHPAGLPGTHIHFLFPVNDARRAWYIGYQDVVAVGHLFLTGELDVGRVVALAGPAARQPRLVRTRIGAHLGQLVEGEVRGNDVRVISGSVLDGRHATPPCNFLGRFHLQVALVPEGQHREFIGWMLPGGEMHSVKRAYASALMPESHRFQMTTSTNGSRRAIVPIGSYEQVMPLDIVATPLLKALATEDTEYAQALGCLELCEEDLALCTYVCPGKYDYGPILRRNLTRIELEG